MDTMIVQDANAVFYPSMDLAKKIFLYDSRHKHGFKLDSLQDEIISELENGKMVKVYSELAAKYSWPLDNKKLDTMNDENALALLDLDRKIAEAGERAGDMEVLDALYEKARFFSKTGQWPEAFVVYDEILAKPKSGTGKKIDALMEKARISFFNLDTAKLTELLTEAKKLADSGGDWDRRNRLKVYEALSLLITRDFKTAAGLLIDGISTFSCVELCSYDQFIFYSIVICIITLSRTELHKKIISNPQIIAVIRTQPKLQSFLLSLYKCDYKTFYEGLQFVYTELTLDRYLSAHIRYLMREYRVLAYAQFLEAYKSVLLASMADAFGITPVLLDQELSHFIAAGRLAARIDKVGGIVVSSRADAKNTQYQDTIRKGDALLNQVQRLVRVIDV